MFELIQHFDRWGVDPTVKIHRPRRDSNLRTGAAHALVPSVLHRTSSEARSRIVDWYFAHGLTVTSPNYASSRYPAHWTRNLTVKHEIMSSTWWIPCAKVIRAGYHHCLSEIPEICSAWSRGLDDGAHEVGLRRLRPRVDSSTTEVSFIFQYLLGSSR